MRFILYFPSAGNVQPLTSRASVCVVVAVEDKHFNNESVPPAPVLPSAFITEHGDAWYGISLWSAGVSCPDCVLSQTLTHPQPLWGENGGMEGGWRESPDAVRALLSNSRNAGILPKPL